MYSLQARSAIRNMKDHAAFLPYIYGTSIYISKLLEWKKKKAFMQLRSSVIKLASSFSPPRIGMPPPPPTKKSRVSKVCVS